MDSRTALVGRGYDQIADRYAQWQRGVIGDGRSMWVDAFVSRVPARARVLELGCGAGTADTQRLAERFRLTGVDVSREQIRRARATVREAELVHGDFTVTEFEPGSFAAVAAIYSLNHVPRDLLAGLLGRIHRWLAPGGVLLASFGTTDADVWTGDWLGTTMFFSSFPPDTNRRLLVEAGFELVDDEIVTYREPEPEGEATTHWVLASR